MGHRAGRQSPANRCWLTLPAHDFKKALKYPVAQLAGVRAWYWAAGIVCVCTAVAGLLIPAVLKLEDQGQAFTRKTVRQVVVDPGRGPDIESCP